MIINMCNGSLSSEKTQKWLLSLIKEVSEYYHIQYGVDSLDYFVSDKKGIEIFIDWLDKTYINPVILYKTQEDDYICKHQPDQCWIKLKGKSK